MKSFEVKVVWRNEKYMGIPQGWTHAKYESSFNESSKEFDRFIDAMGYINNVRKYNNVVKITYINHKTGEIKENI